MSETMDAAELLHELQVALVARNVGRGFDLLDHAFVQGARLDFTRPESIPLLLSAAQWTDLGYRDVEFFDALALDTPAIDRAQLALVRFCELSMAEAYRRLASEELAQCIDSLDVVLRIGHGVLDDYQLFLAHFWKGRAHRKRGDYEHALDDIAAAQAAAVRAQAPKLIAVTRIHESWLAFQRGDRPLAFQLLDDAEQELRPTGHALSLGNIESARGRFVRRSGEYTRALKHFETAVSIFRSNFPKHPNLARALVNAAYVKRLIALDLQPNGASKHVRGATHTRALQLSREALELLAEAAGIYEGHQHQGGVGAVLVNAAHLHLESGDIVQAGIESQRAFQLAEEKQDLILMARAKIIQSGVALARADEELGDDQDVALHANLSVTFADSAIAIALRTQNQRLLTEAYIARGMAAAGAYVQDWEIAREYAGKAAALVNQNDRDHLVKELANLKAKLAGATRVEEMLRLWSEGDVGNKTFQEIQEEFAELVIPKVWQQSGRNITAVAKKLSVSPKKIRRILRNVKL